MNTNATAAHKYRLHQAEVLLREAGFIPASDGTWHPSEEEAREHEAHSAQG